MTIGELVFPGEGVDDPTLSTANLSVSANGLLAYIGGHSRSQVKSFDRSGRELTAVDMSTLLYSPALSPDQKQLLVANRDVNRGVWLVDLSRGVSTRIILDGRRSLWSPDGTRIVFDAERAGENSFFIRPTTGSNEDKPLLSTRYSKSLNDWSRDGRYILYTSYMPNTKNALWILPMFGEQRPKPFLQAPFNEMQGEISPDGHWVAYISDESGSWEVYLQSFPEPGRAQVISIGGGTEPHWRKDGKELFYLAPDHTLMTVPITLNSPPAIERPRALFRSPVFSMAGIVSNQFAVSADGQRFLFVAEEKTTKEVDQVTVLSSWPNLLTH
jgi:Tol biopolymer transport system component